ncbi:hypothetical protein AA650_17090 [Anabaena sp. WA102]|nr:hypothetical protein AA650_17090 [Anabaena sp. WA102]
MNTIKPIYVKKSKIPQTLFTLAFCMSASCLAITTIFNANLLTLTGKEGNDQLVGDAGNDSLLGNEGDDNLQGRAGDDILSGGDNNDQLQRFPII